MKVELTSGLVQNWGATSRSRVSPACTGGPHQLWLTTASRRPGCQHAGKVHLQKQLVCMMILWMVMHMQLVEGDRSGQSSTHAPCTYLLTAGLHARRAKEQV